MNRALSTLKGNQNTLPSKLLCQGDIEAYREDSHVPITKAFQTLSIIANIATSDWHSCMGEAFSIDEDQRGFSNWLYDLYKEKDSEAYSTQTTHVTILKSWTVSWILVLVKQRGQTFPIWYVFQFVGIAVFIQNIISFNKRAYGERFLPYKKVVSRESCGTPKVLIQWNGHIIMKWNQVQSTWRVSSAP